LVGHQVAELFQCGGAAIGWRPVVVVAVFQEDLAERAVAQTQGAFASGHAPCCLGGLHRHIDDAPLKVSILLITFTTHNMHSKRRGN